MKYIQKQLFSVAILAACVCVDVCATDYRAILQQIDANNVELKAQSERNRAEESRKRADNALNGPEVDFSYLFGDPSVGDKWEIGASQSFDWFGLYNSRGKAIKAESSALQHQLEARRKDIHAEVLAVCSEIVWLNKRLDVQKSIYADMQALAEAYGKAFEHGEASVLDINKLKIEVASARRVLRDIEAQIADASVRLAELNGGVAIDAGALTEYAGLQLPPSIDEFVAYAASHDPMAAYYAGVARADAHNVSVARGELMPSFSLGYRHVNELGDHFNGITAGVSIPLYKGKKNIKAAKSLEIANALEADKWQKELGVILRKEYAQACKLHGELTEFDAAMPADNLVLLRKALDAGHISLINYLLEVRYFSEALMQRLDIEYQYQLAVMRINRYWI